MPSGVPTVARSASVSPASVTVRFDGAAVFQLRYVRGGDLHTVLGEHTADRLDPETAGPHLVDESADQRWRGSVKVGPGRGDSRCGWSVFPGRFPNPACTFQCTGLSTRPGQAAVVSSSGVGHGEGMTAPR